MNIHEFIIIMRRMRRGHVQTRKRRTPVSTTLAPTISYTHIIIDMVGVGSEKVTVLLKRSALGDRLDVRHRPREAKIIGNLVYATHSPGNLKAKCSHPNIVIKKKRDSLSPSWSLSLCVSPSFFSFLCVLWPALPYHHPFPLSHRAMGGPPLLPPHYAPASHLLTSSAPSPPWPPRQAHDSPQAPVWHAPSHTAAVHLSSYPRPCTSSPPIAPRPTLPPPSLPAPREGPSTFETIKAPTTNAMARG